MRIYDRQLLEREIIYLRKELDEYIIAKIDGQSVSEKNIEKNKIFWRQYQITSILLIGSVIIFSLLLCSLIFAANFDIWKKFEVFYINYLRFLICATLFFEILFIIFFTFNFIIKPIINFFKCGKSKKNSYYSTEAKQYKIANDTILSLKIGNQASKNACNIVINEINYTITLKKKNKIELSILLFYFLLLFIILFFLDYNNLIIFIKKQNISLDNIRLSILFGISIVNFFAFFIKSFWNIESPEIIIYRRFVSILERAINIAK